MKKLLLLLSFIALRNELLGMEEMQMPSIIQKYERTAANKEESWELKKVTVNTAVQHEQLDQKLTVLLEKIADLEKNQKDQRSCKTKIMTTVSMIGSMASTIGLLLYLASWYVEF